MTRIQDIENQLDQLDQKKRELQHELWQLRRQAADLTKLVDCPIAVHLGEDQYLGSSWCTGRQYKLTPEQKSFIQARYGIQCTESVDLIAIEFSSEGEVETLVLRNQLPRKSGLQSVTLFRFYWSEAPLEVKNPNPQKPTTHAGKAKTTKKITKTKTLEELVDEYDL